MIVLDASALYALLFFMLPGFIVFVSVRNHFSLDNNGTISTFVYSAMGSVLVYTIVVYYAPLSNMLRPYLSFKINDTIFSFVNKETLLSIWALELIAFVISLCIYYVVRKKWFTRGLRRITGRSMFVNVWDDINTNLVKKRISFKLKENQDIYSGILEKASSYGNGRELLVIGVVVNSREYGMMYVNFDDIEYILFDKEALK